MTQIKRDSTIRIKTTWKDFAGTLVDPASHSLQFYEPDGTASGSAITNPTGGEGAGMKGIFYYDLDTGATDTLGLWKWVWKATIASLDEIQDGEFEIVGRVID